jgi:hypothetical protein
MEVIKALKKTIYKTDKQIGAWLNIELAREIQQCKGPLLILLVLGRLLGRIYNMCLVLVCV